MTRRLLVAALCLLAWARPASAQIAFDAASADALDSSWSHTITGSNAVLIVGCLGQYQGASGTLISAVKWNTTETLTAVHSEPWILETNPGALGRWDNLYYLLSPTTGTHTIAVTSTADHYACQAVSWTGVGALDTSAGVALGSASNTGSTTMTVGTNAWIFSFSRGGTFSSWTNATARTTNNGLNSFSADSNGALSGSQTTTITTTGSTGGAILSVSFTPSGGGGAVTSVCNSGLLLLGAGCGGD